MNTFQFSDVSERRHRVHRQPGSSGVQVDEHMLEVQPDGEGRFRVTALGQSARVHAFAEGDSVYVQLRGRAWRIDRIDATRASASAAGSGAGTSRAPMPGVVVSLLAAAGQHVNDGDALLVIESMKLQMTIVAECAGRVQQLPLEVGQTFQRGAVLAQVQPDEVSP
jgi:biotin carboxyl carrier protein